MHSGSWIGDDFCGDRPLCMDLGEGGHHVSDPGCDQGLYPRGSIQRSGTRPREMVANSAIHQGDQRLQFDIVISTPQSQTQIGQRCFKAMGEIGDMAASARQSLRIIRNELVEFVGQWCNLAGLPAGQPIGAPGANFSDGATKSLERFVLGGPETPWPRLR